MSFEQKRKPESALADLAVSNSRTRRAFLCLATLLPAVLAWGCTGIVNGQNTPPPPQTYSVSGTISPAAGGNGATVTLSGTASATTTANSSGAFTFTGLANGTYTVTPSHAGYTFAPPNQNTIVSGANVTGVNFTATAQTNPTYTISGTISPVAGGSGATVTLSGASTATATADNTGSYIFRGLVNGRYAVTPSRTGYTFSPTSQSATVNGANVTALNFTATAQVGATFSISGTISPTTGGSGAAVLLSGPAAATATTNAAGNYSFTGLAKGTYVVTPANPGYSFSPANQSVSINTANVSGVNFSATAQVPHTVALTWNASPSAISGYNVYRSTISGTGYAMINSSPVTVLGYTDYNVTNGTTYYYVTTAVDSKGAESTFSNQATAVIP